VPPTEFAVLRNTFFVLHFVSVSLISSTTVDVSDGNILSVLFFVCSNVWQERIVFVLSVTALVQQIGFGDAVEYKWVGRYYRKWEDGWDLFRVSCGS
jgi:hypothetical protein